MLTQEPQSPSAAYGVLPEKERGDQGVALGDILLALRRRLWWIVATAIVGTTLAIAAGEQVTPKYTATASLVIDPTGSRLTDVMERQGSLLSADPEFVETQISLMTSRSHLTRVMNELEQAGSPVFQSSGAQDEPQLQNRLPDLIRNGLAALLDQWRFLSGSIAASTAAVAQRSKLDELKESVQAAERAAAAGVITPRSEEEALTPRESIHPRVKDLAAIDRFRSRLSVGQRDTSYVIDVSFTSPDPERAARVANAVVEYYVASEVERKQEAANQAAVWLEERLSELEATLRESERAAAEYEAARGLFGSDGAAASGQLVQLNQYLIAHRTQQTQAASRLRRAREMRSSTDQLDTLAQILESPLLSDLRSEEGALLRERAELAQIYGEQHPRIANLRAELASVRERIGRQIDYAISKLEDDLAGLESQERALLESLERAREEKAQDEQARVRLRELERKADADRHLYDVVLRRLKEAQEQAQVSTPDARIISRAVAPPGPSTPGIGVFTMVGFTASTMLGTFLAFLLERLDRRVRSAVDLERVLEIPVLGLLPSLPNRRARRRPGSYVRGLPFSGFAEAARSMLMQLRHGYGGAAAKVLLVTSALPEEGKTTFSISLAAVAEREGLRVLLVDLDLRRPSIHRALGLPTDCLGLMDYLCGRASDDQIVQREPQLGIDVIVAGGRSGHYPVEILQRSELRHLIDAARREYDLVILDSAPVLAVSDTRMVALLADRTVFAVRWHRTEVSAVVHAVRSLLTFGVAVTGCMLTAVNMRRYKMYASDAGRYYGRNRRYYQAS